MAASQPDRGVTSERTPLAIPNPSASPSDRLGPRMPADNDAASRLLRRPSDTGPRTFLARADDRGDVLLVTVGGDLDVYSTPNLRRLLARAGRVERDMVFDLRQVAFIDSSGLAAIASAARYARIHGHTVGVVATNPVLVRVMTIVRLDTQCIIGRTIEAVRETLRSSGRPLNPQEEP
jgi:anti-sigma B factor antagonist